MANPKDKGMALMIGMIKKKKPMSDAMPDESEGAKDEGDQEEGEEPDWKGVAAEMLAAFKSEDKDALSEVLKNYSEACRNM